MQAVAPVLDVLERCNFIWLQNTTYVSSFDESVLERCNFIWLQNSLLGDEFCGASFRTV